MVPTNAPENVARKTAEERWGFSEDAELVEPVQARLPVSERLPLHAAVVLLLVFPLFIGGKFEPARLAFQGVVFLGALAASVVAFVRGGRSFRLGWLGRRLEVLAVIALVLIGLQLLVVPVSVLQVVAPASAEAYRLAESAWGSISLDRASTQASLAFVAATFVFGLWLVVLPYRHVRTPVSRRSSAQRLRRRSRHQLFEQARLIDSATDKFQRAIITVALVASAIALAVLTTGAASIFELLGATVLPSDSARAHWPFTNANHFAVLMEMAAVLAFTRLLRLMQLSRLRSRSDSERRNGMQLLRNPEKLGTHATQLLAVFVLLVSGILSLSRMGGVLLVLGLLLVWHMYGKTQFVGTRRTERRGREPLIVSLLRRFRRPLIAGAAVVLVLFFLGQTGRERLAGRIEYGLAAGVDIARVQLNHASLDVIATYPIAGVGLGNWHVAASRWIPPT
ncbi:MAG: hypothetical protein KDD44_01705, partial [Bdellovibrionales bacterium]|nr:hypothetical protein [Bdellovibrionales bacterium]